MLGMEMPAAKGMEMPGMDMKPNDMKNMPKKGSEKPDAELDHGKMNMKSEAMQKPMPSHPGMKGMEGMARIEGRPEALGMRPGWSMGVEGLFTVVRVLPPELYEKIMDRLGHEGHQMH